MEAVFGGDGRGSSGMGIGEDPRNRRGSMTGNGGGLFEERREGSLRH